MTRTSPSWGYDTGQHDYGVQSIVVRLHALLSILLYLACLAMHE
jgi:hypothetical protein